MFGRVMIVGLIAAAVIAGCGGDDGDKQASESSGTATQATSESELAARSLKAGELEGFEPSGAGTSEDDAGNWLTLTSDTTIGADEYAKRGFVAGYKLDLESSAGVAGQNLIVQVGTPAQARAEVIRNSKPAPGTDTTPFPVSGLPGARGFTAKGTTVGDNVAFSAGSYFYAVGRVRPPDVSAKESRDSVIAAAKTLYARVH